MSCAKFSIAICELHHPSLHGMDSNSTPGIDEHYIASYIIEPDDFINCIQECQGIAASMMRIYARVRLPKHGKIRNYKKLVERPEYFQPQLVQLTQLQPGDECVAAIKTHLIIRIQRRWRSFASRRKQILHRRMQPQAIAIRQTTGQWPPELRKFPCLYNVKKSEMRAHVA